MGQTDGGSKGKTAGLLASAIAVITLASTVGKTIWDSKEAHDKDALAQKKAADDAKRDREAKASAERDDRRRILLLISHLGTAMADQHIQLLKPGGLVGPLDTLSVKTAMDDLKISEHFRSPTSQDEFERYDKDVNETIHVKFGKKAWFIYQGLELSQESIDALSFGMDGDKAVRAPWLKAWSPNWSPYVQALTIDAAMLGVTIDVPVAYDPDQPQPTIEQLGSFQDRVKNAIEWDKIPKEGGR